VNRRPPVPVLTGKTDHDVPLTDREECREHCR
jgi:hypothetical protein